MTAEVVAAYTEYVKARKKYRDKARQQVRKDLLPHLVEVGKAVLDAQNDGLSIAEVARTLDIKNRNFIYQAKRAYADATGEDIKVREYVRETNTVTKQKDDPDYTIVDLGGGNFEVTVFGEDHYITTDEDSGRPLFPEEWAEAGPASRAVYRAIVREIENA